MEMDIQIMDFVDGGTEMFCAWHVCSPLIFFLLFSWRMQGKAAVGAPGVLTSLAFR